jgi:hypothetical protein
MQRTDIESNGETTVARRSSRFSGNFTRSILALFAVSVLAVSMVIHTISTSAAGSASFSLSPSASSVIVGATVSVVVKVNTSDAINTAQADLTYDASKLRFDSADPAGTNFDFPLSSTGGGGSISVARGVSNAGTVTGSLTLTTLRFTALGNSGSAAVTIAPSSLIIRPSDGEDVWNGVTTSTSIALAPVPAATPPPAPPKTATAATPPAKVSAPAPAAATPAGTTPATQQVAPIADDTPVPVSNSLTQEGYLIAIQVLGPDKKALVGAEVTLGDKKTVTDQTGLASFVNVPAGEQTVTVNGVKKTVTIVEGDTTSVQDFTIDAPLADESSDGFSWIDIAKIAGAILLLILLIGGGITGFKKWKKSRVKTASFSGSPPSTSSHSSGALGNTGVHGTTLSSPITPSPLNSMEPTTILPTQPPTDPVNVEVK